MVIEFYKYHGTGNDFIIIDDFESKFEKSQKNIQKTISLLCHRRFGIGADGLMLLQKSKKYEFKMKYFNSDGLEGSMCGNGARCISAFAFKQGYVSNKMIFEAIDGEHHAQIDKVDIKVKMSNVEGYKKIKSAYVIDTGSPHYVEFVKNVENLDVIKKGKKIRHSETFEPLGVNVNFVEIAESFLKVRTFERGVEDETLSCGTGVVASAIAAFLKGHYTPNNNYKIETTGGKLSVKFSVNNDSGLIEDIWLKGPAELVFKGMIEKDIK
jgi:diaminopimelate epimerase